MLRWTERECHPEENVGTVLMISVDAEAIEHFRSAVRGKGHRLEVVPSLVEGDRFAAVNGAHVLIVDLELEDVEGPGIVPLMKERIPDADIVVLGSRYSRELDLKLREAGVLHYAVKPLQGGRAAGQVRHSLEKRGDNGAGRSR